MPKSHPIKTLNIFESLDYSTGEGFSLTQVRDQIIARIEAKFSDYVVQKDDPLYELVSAFSYREILLREGINTIARQFCEELTRINSRKALPVGSKGYYEKLARDEAFTKNAQGGLEAGVSEAVVRCEADGLLSVYVVFAPTCDEKNKGQMRVRNFDEKRELLAHLNVEMNHQSKRILSDVVRVQEATEIPVQIEAEVLRSKESVVDREYLEECLKSALATTLKLGVNLHTSWLISLLHVPGVEQVSRMTVAPQRPLKFNEYYRVGNIKIEVF